MQGDIGDCFLIASIAALAYHEPETLMRAARVVDDEVVVETDGTEYRMARTLPAHAVGIDIFARAADGSTLAAFLEKAYASKYGGYEAINYGGWSAEALSWLSGRTAASIELDGAPDEAIRRIVTSRRPVVASSKTPSSLSEEQRREAAGYVLVAHEAHAYTVVGTNTDGEILLYNPWGRFHPRPMPIEALRRLFECIDWC